MDRNRTETNGDVSVRRKLDVGSSKNFFQRQSEEKRQADAAKNYGESFVQLQDQVYEVLGDSFAQKFEENLEMAKQKINELENSSPDKSQKGTINSSDRAQKANSANALDKQLAQLYAYHKVLAQDRGYNSSQIDEESLLKQVKEACQAGNKADAYKKLGNFCNKIKDAMGNLEQQGSTSEDSEYEKYVKDVLQKMVEGLECQSGRITLEDVQNNSARYRVRYSVKEELSKLEKIVNVLNDEIGEFFESKKCDKKVCSLVLTTINNNMDYIVGNVDMLFNNDGIIEMMDKSQDAIKDHSRGIISQIEGFKYFVSHPHYEEMCKLQKEVPGLSSDPHFKQDYKPSVKTIEEILQNNAGTVDWSKATEQLERSYNYIIRYIDSEANAIYKKVCSNSIAKKISDGLPHPPDTVSTCKALRLFKHALGLVDSFRQAKQASLQKSVISQSGDNSVSSQNSSDQPSMQSLLPIDRFLSPNYGLPDSTLRGPIIIEKSVLRQRPEAFQDTSFLASASVENSRDQQGNMIQQNEVSSQNSGADQLAKPEQEHSGESSSAAFPQDIEKIQTPSEINSIANQQGRHEKEMQIIPYPGSIQEFVRKIGAKPQEERLRPSTTSDQPSMQSLLPIDRFLSSNDELPDLTLRGPIIIEKSALRQRPEAFQDASFSASASVENSRDQQGNMIQQNEVSSQNSGAINWQSQDRGTLVKAHQQRFPKILRRYLLSTVTI